jgi:hypothetical protein
VDPSLFPLLLLLLLLLDVLILVALALDTVTGTLDPLASGSAMSVVHACPLSGHTSFLSKSLSSGPVGPLSYLQVKLRFRKLSCRGSLSRYCSSPHLPRKYSHDTGVSGSEPTKVPFTDDVGVYE